MFPRLLLAFLAIGMLGAAAGLAARETAPVPVILLVAVVALGPAWYFARTFVRPLADIRHGAERIARGEYGEHVHGGGWRELRELAHAFNAMSDRLAEQIDRLEAERHHLRAVLGGMVEGVVAVGPGQRVLFANAAAGRLLEFDPARVLGRALYEVSRQPAVQAVLERAAKTRQPQREETELPPPAARHLSVYAAPLTADGPGAVLVLHDTTEIRRLERLRQDFVANVSHELKTPLAVVKACAEALADGAVEDAQARGPFLQQITEQAERLHALILDLLSLARLESGEASLDLEPVPLAAAVGDCLDRHRPRAEAKRMTLEAVAPPDAVSAWADPEALAQVLDNLVDNAVKYTQEGGTVRVRWSARAGDACVTVEDNGPGIPARDLLRVFERFYRVDRARSRELGGTGLGLSIVKHLAQAMGGSVKATSEVGRGSTFTVCLPRPPAGS
jgi:two-component system phosphate regulon sensor histidine kinase PhoR